MTTVELIERLTEIIEEQAEIIDELAEMLLQYEAVESSTAKLEM